MTRQAVPLGMEWFLRSRAQVRGRWAISTAQSPRTPAPRGPAAGARSPVRAARGRPDRTVRRIESGPDRGPRPPGRPDPSERAAGPRGPRAARAGRPPGATGATGPRPAWRSAPSGSRPGCPVAPDTAPGVEARHGAARRDRQVARGSACRPSARDCGGLLGRGRSHVPSAAGVACPAPAQFRAAAGIKRCRERRNAH
jgi:hypothetical protein